MLYINNATPVRTIRKVVCGLLCALLTLGSFAGIPVYAADTGKPGSYQTISTGGSHMAFIGTDGALYMSGNGYYGQLGTGKTTNTTTPIKVKDNVVSVSCGYAYTMAIDKNGTLYGWGNNASGQLGTGDTTNTSSPVKVMDNVIAVACGRSNSTPFTAAVKTDGTLWVWGDSSVGQNGTTTSSSKPVKVMDHVAAVSCGNHHISAIKTDSSLWQWGGNTRGQIAKPVKTTYSKTPTKVMDNVAAVSNGADFTAAITTKGALYTWGNGEYGQLGAGDRKDSTTPIQILSKFKFSTVSCGTNHAAAISTDGTLYTWGCGQTGRLGISATNKYYGEDMINPIQVATGMGAVHCGYYDLMAVTTDGNLWTCGYNANSALGYEGGDTTVNNSNNSGTSPVQSKPKHVSGFTVKLPDGAPTVNPGGNGGGNNGSGNGGNNGGNNGGSGNGNPGNNGGNTPGGNQAATGFTDVSPNAYYADAVRWAVKNGITSGTGNGKFSPNNNCTLAEIVTMLWRAAGRPSSTTSCPFSLQPSSPYYTALCWAEEKAILDREGIGTTTIVSRALTVTYLWRAAGCPSSNKTVQFDDVPRNASYTAALAWGVQNKIVNGSGNKFSPDAYCTRAQVVTFLYRMYN